MCFKKIYIAIGKHVIDQKQIHSIVLFDNLFIYLPLARPAMRTALITERIVYETREKNKLQTTEKIL